MRDERRRVGSTWRALGPAWLGAARRCVLTGASLLWLGACEERAPDVSSLDSAPSDVSTVSSAGESEETGRLFIAHCAACHGVDGHGDGPAAEQLFPPPRAFADSPLRFASLEGGSEGTRDGIVRTIRFGMPRSAMPGFDGVLTDAQIDDLGAYVLGLGRGISQQPAIDSERMRRLISRVPSLENPGLIDRGRELFVMWKCTSCHGPHGHGDGEAMNNLIDSIGRPVQPANLTSGLFKSGGTPSEIFRAIANGVPGTPMTPYGGLLLRENSDGTTHTQDVWALVAYVRSLAPRWRTGGPASGVELRLHELSSEAVLGDLTHPDWMGVTWQHIGLRPTWERSTEPISIHVAAIRSGDRVGILVSWPDATMDVKKDAGRFPDAAAVMFALGDEVPAIPMGVGIPGANPPGRVNLWLWKADRQLAATAGEAPAIATAAPSGDDRVEFAPASGEDPAQAPVLDRAGFPVFPPASVGNVHSDPTLLLHAGLEANASGFGTLEYQASDDQGVRGWAVWAPGRWTAIVYREVASGDDVRLDSGARIPIAFAVWDGSQGHRDGTKFVSGWHWLVVD